MFANAKLYEQMAVLSTIDPVSQGAGSVATAWVKASDFHNILAVLQTGVLGTSATVDAKLRQAKDSSGTSAKDVTNKSITQIVKATGDNKQALIEMRTDELDSENGFDYVELSVTVGTAASLISAVLLGGNPRSASPASLNQAAVAQTVY